MIRKLVLPLLLVAMLSGCSSGERRRVSRETNSLTTAYVTRMDKGQTTPDQDKRFIKAIATVALELDKNIRGEKKALQTMREAQALAAAGLQPGAPIDLDH